MEKETCRSCLPGRRNGLFRLSGVKEGAAHEPQRGKEIEGLIRGAYTGTEAGKGAPETKPEPPQRTAQGDLLRGLLIGKGGQKKHRQQRKNIVCLILKC